MEEDYFSWFIGKTFADLDGMTVATNGTMHGFSNTAAVQFDSNIDDFADSTVSTNNFLRVIVELLRYHEVNY